LSRLSQEDADLFFTTSCYFVCHFMTHRMEVCRQRGLGMLFCKQLNDPYHEWLDLSAIDVLTV
jgi:hypothetical protein